MKVVMVALLGAALLTGCATSESGTACDPLIQTCTCGDGLPTCPGGYDCVEGICSGGPDGGGTVIDGGGGPDSGPIIDAGPTVDAAPLAGFGEPCTDKGDCESNICIFVNTGGICSELCGAGTCPEGFGCFGVWGAIEPGQVAEVCVPIGDQLCTQCEADTECSIIGMDKCLTYPDGKQFCSRDCSSVECPDGYDCETVDVGGVDLEQCIPQSGACDCRAPDLGDVEACTITTPLGTVCPASRTCGGDAGWGDCLPPSPSDSPDGTYTDSNCDGIDGDVTRGIFVAGGGADSSGCGLTWTSPCATISYGAYRAATTSGRTEVYVQAGTYAEAVVMQNGIHIWGGYDFNWQRGPYAEPAHRVIISGGQDNASGGAGEYLAIRAHGVLLQTTIADLIINGPTAVGNSGGNGHSSYAIHADSANLVLTRVSINAGNGAPGATGSAGQSAPIVDAQSFMNGTGGGNADEYITTCDNTSHGAGGNRGTNSCSGPSGRDPDGGAGGAGGEMDTDCDIWSLNLNTTPGDSGSYADYSSGSYGSPGGGGSDNGCGSGGGGNGGRIANGSGGPHWDAGYVWGGYWYARGGGAGGTGENGGGGGGAGGSGGCGTGTDSYGAGGGGGAAGGCAAQSGGGGGGGGGSSFGVFAISNSVIAMSSCAITRGSGGTGGTGGTGGRGQSGGVGGNPGQGSGDSADGGYGGNGAHGGHGGGGGGGQGGRSAGIVTTPGTSVTQDCSITGGSPGSGGTGGDSAPTAPVPERDGNPGQSGSPGTVVQVLNCASVDDC